MAAELKDLRFSQPTPEPRVTLAKDKGRKSLHYYIGKFQINGSFWEISHISDFFGYKLLPSRVLLSPPEISSSEPCLRGQVLLICLVNKANLLGECLRIKFIWTSFSARPPLPTYCSRQSRRGHQIDHNVHNRRSSHKLRMKMYQLEMCSRASLIYQQNRTKYVQNLPFSCT